MNLVIYGAQAIALGAYEAIHKLYPVRLNIVHAGCRFLT